MVNVDDPGFDSTAGVCARCMLQRRPHDSDGGSVAGHFACYGKQHDMPGQGDTGGKGIPRTETLRQREPC
jgi:hypothetical protein